MFPASCIRWRGCRIRVAWHWPPTGGDKVHVLDHLPGLCPRRRRSPKRRTDRPPTARSDHCPPTSRSSPPSEHLLSGARLPLEEALAPTKPNSAAVEPLLRLSAASFLTAFSLARSLDLRWGFAPSTHPPASLPEVCPARYCVGDVAGGLGNRHTRHESGSRARS